MDFAELRQAIMQMVKPLIKKQQRRGKATNINTTKCTCDVDLENGIVLHGVKLKATEGGADKGIVIVPKDKTYVVAAMVEDVEADWCLVQVEEIDSAAFFFKNGGKQEMKDNGEIHLNGSNFGELMKIQEVVSDFNEIKQDINSLKNILSAWTPVAQDGGAALKGAVASWFAQPLQDTVVNDLKNSKVKHGG